MMPPNTILKRFSESCVQSLFADAETWTAGVARFVRMWDGDDEALKPEWEIDPKALQILEKVGPVLAAN